MRQGLRRFLRWLVLLRGSPEAIARGMAIGTLVAFTPTLGIQTPLALLLTTLANANRPISVVPVWITNPATAVPIYGFTYWIGSWFWPTAMARWPVGHSLGELAAAGRDLFVPLWIGGLLVGGLAALIAYFVTLRLVEAARRRLRKRRARRRAKPRPGR